MYYSIEEQTIIFQHDNINLYQFIDPETQKPFISKSAQYKWAEKIIAGYFDTIKLEVNYTNLNNNPIKNLYGDKKFKIKISCDIKEDFSIKANILSKTEDSFNEEIELNFKEGAATYEAKLPKGEYYIVFNDEIIIKDKLIHAVHEKYEYSMYLA